MSLKRYGVDFGYNDPTTIVAIHEGKDDNHTYNPQYYHTPTMYREPQEEMY